MRIIWHQKKVTETGQILRMQTLEMRIPKAQIPEVPILRIRIQRIPKTEITLRMEVRIIWMRILIQKRITIVIMVMDLIIMTKIRTEITVMRPITSEDKKILSYINTSIWAFCQRLFCKCFG